MKAFDSAQAALGFVIGQTSHVERGVYARKYPDITYASMIPVDTSAAAWATSVTYFSSDSRGRAEWVGADASDIPLVNSNREKHEKPVTMAAVGYDYNLEEINQARMLGINLTNDKAASARRFYEEFVEDIAYNGDNEKGFQGLLSHSAVTAAAAPNGAAASPLWTSKTPDEMLSDINGAITGIWVDSKTVEMADTIILPLDQYALIAGKRIGPDTGQTVLQHIKNTNIYTVQTGQPLKIRAMRQLKGKGAGSTDRMIAYRRDPEVLKLHIPMPLKFITPQADVLRVIVPGMFRLGGVDIRRPGSCRYVDGI